jgi:hypothetical protein
MFIRPLQGSSSIALHGHRLRDARSHLLQAAAFEYGEVIALDDCDVDAARGERTPTHPGIQEQASRFPRAAQERYFPGI